jgi:hypothetical protein
VCIFALYQVHQVTTQLFHQLYHIGWCTFHSPEASRACLQASESSEKSYQLSDLWYAHSSLFHWLKLTLSVHRINSCIEVSLLGF